MVLVFCFLPLRLFSSRLVLKSLQTPRCAGCAQGDLLLCVVVVAVAVAVVVIDVDVVDVVVVVVVVCLFVCLVVCFC